MKILHQDKDLQLRRTLCKTLAEIARHTPELGAKVADSGVLPFVSAFLEVEQPDARLKAEVKFMQLSTHLYEASLILRL